jgi:prolyl oligopeptidase
MKRRSSRTANRCLARMEEMNAKVIYRENIEGGHAGTAGSRRQALMSALASSFLEKELASPGP